MEFTINKSFSAVTKKKSKIAARIDDCVEYQPEEWAEALAERLRNDPSNPRPVDQVFTTITPISHQVLPITENKRVVYLITAVVQATFEFLLDDDLDDDDDDEDDDVIVAAEPALTPMP